MTRADDDRDVVATLRDEVRRSAVGDPTVDSAWLPPLDPHRRRLGVAPPDTQHPAAPGGPSAP